MLLSSKIMSFLNIFSKEKETSSKIMVFTQIMVLTFIVVLRCIIMVNASESFVKPAPTDPWFNSTLPPEPRPGYYRFLGDCIDKITKSCHIQVFDAIFKEILVNDLSCCQNIIKANYTCNRSLSYIFGRFDIFKSNATLISQQSNKIYHHCHEIVT